MNKQTFFAGKTSKAFFNDAFTIAKTIRTTCPEQAETVIKNANDVANQTFLFNLRWDMERTHEPVIFENEIDWLYQPGDDPEWVFAFNRMRFWICLGQAYALTGDEKYAAAFVRQLNGWVNTVHQTDPACEKAWRSIEVGLRLEYWLKAIWYFKNSPTLTDETVNTFYESVVEHAEFIMNVWNTYNLMSNWGVLANHGLYLAGALLPESERTAEYLAEATRRLNLEMQMQVYRDGFQWEQSPMYHNEVLHCFLDVVLLAQRGGHALPKEFISKTHDMCLVDLWAAKPNHDEIAMGDSDTIDQRDLISKGALLFGDPTLKNRGYEIPDFDTTWDIGEAGLAAYSALPSTAPEKTDKPLWDSGNFYLRSSWEENATFLHLHCGTLGAGHGHADQLHLDLFANGEDILVDAGRYTYVFGPGREEFKAASAHNTILVDGIEPYPCKDSWECHSLGRPVNRQFYTDERYGYAEGAHLAYMELPTGGVLVNRRVIFLKPNIIVVADECYTGSAHCYDTCWHFSEQGKLQINGSTATFAGKRARADIAFLTPNATIEPTPSRISRVYNKAVENPALRVRSTATGIHTSFTVFAVGESGENTGLAVEKLPVKSSFKGHTFPDETIEALRIRTNTTSHTVVVAHKEFATPTDTFEAGGCTSFGSCVVFDDAKNEAEIGTVLLW